MRLYELNYLISAELSEEEIKALEEKINSSIQEEGGILGEINSPVRKTLSYPIQKKHSAYLVTLSFQLPPEKLESLEKKLKAEGQILRYLILTKELPKMMAAPAVRPKRIIKPKPKVELKEIEKKLEEILGEKL